MEQYKKISFGHLMEKKYMKTNNLNMKTIVKQIVKQQIEKMQMKDGFATTPKMLQPSLQESLKSTVQKILTKHYTSNDAMKMINKPEFQTIIQQCVKKLMDEIIG